MMSEKIKYLADEHFPKRAIDQLWRRGVDIVHCEDEGLAGADDQDILEYAVQEKRTLVSMDHHFLQWHRDWLAAGRTHSGIMRIQPHLQGEKNMGRIIEALYEYHLLISIGVGTLKEDIYNQLIIIR